MRQPIRIIPTVDIVFHAIFGDERHPELTKALLNSVLPLTGGPEVTEVRVLNPFSLSTCTLDKEIILDIHALDQMNREYQIEMQVRHHAHFPLRVMDNWSRLYRQQLSEGNEYGKHRPLVCLWVVKENIPDTDSWLDGARVRRDSDGTPYSDHLKFVFLQLDRWRSLQALDKKAPERYLKERFPEGTFSEEDFRRVDTLARFLSESQDWEPGYVPEELSESWVEEAMSVVNAFALDDRARDLYERRLEAERVWKDLIETSEQRGIAKGKAEGKVEGKAEGKAEGKVEGLMEGLEQGKIGSCQVFCVNYLAYLTDKAEFAPRRKPAVQP